MTGHHTDPGTVRRPPRLPTRWRQARAERACRKATGHCWHPGGFIDWFCCMCSAEVDGMPANNCVYCRRHP